VKLLPLGRAINMDLVVVWAEGDLYGDGKFSGIFKELE
jgi:hypothetical protein